MRVILEIQSGPHPGRFLTIPQGSEVIVGRKAPADFIIDGDLTLSRAHFALTCDPPLCLIRDLHSRGGTFLNGEAISLAEVKNGDIIEAGSTYLIVRIDPKAPAPSIIPTQRPSTPVETIDRDGPPTEEIPPSQEESLHDRVLKQLRSQKDPLFAILDAARDPLILVHLLNSHEQYQSLYEGPKGERLAAAAPYLVSLPPTSPFLETLVREGWGNSWGVYLTSQASFAEVRKHLRRFLLVKTEEGKELLFRFYDPRVLRVFLPTCNPDELMQFFGMLDVFIMEDQESSTLLRLSLDGRQLQRFEAQVISPVSHSTVAR